MQDFVTQGEARMDTTIEPKESRSGETLISYINRRGQQYFVHQGVTKTGKPKYFTSQKKDGAIRTLPEGYEIGENINAMVFVQRPKPILIPTSDLQRVRDKVVECRRLEHYQVEAKDITILIYEPLGMEAVKAIDEITSPSSLDTLKAMMDRLGRSWKDELAKTAADMGITVAELKHADALASAEKREKTTDFLMRNMQYAPVMRFTLDRESGKYQVARRCYRGEEHWAALGFGSIEKMANRYIKHIGEESFFDLV